MLRGRAATRTGRQEDMAYVPLNGRRATLAFFAAVALGFTLVGLSLDLEPTGKAALPRAAVASEPEADEQNGAIPVVNPDGSLRQPADASAMGADASGQEDPDFAMEQDDGMDDAPADESEADWSASDRPVQQAVAGRIE
jgi:hypothetical protein